MNTTDDLRLNLWARRQSETERLAQLRVARTRICGCPTCADADKGEELGALVRECESFIEELGGQICARPVLVDG